MKHALVCLVLSSVLIAMGDAQSVSERHTETYRADAQTDLVLHNVVGDISVDAWDQAHVQVDWLLNGYTRRSLDNAWVEINPGNGKLEIRTAYPVAKDAAARAREISVGPDSVNFAIHVPRHLHSVEITTEDGDVNVAGVGSDLRISSRNGSVSLEDVGGNLEVRTIHASQAIRLGRLSGHRSIQLQSVNGSIRLSLARSSDAALRVSSANGGISNDFGWAPRRTQFDRNLHGKLGNGDVQVDVQEVNGSVSLLAESR